MDRISRPAALTAMLLAAIAAATTGCATSTPAPAASPGPGAGAGARNDYRDDRSWLCRPGRRDACATDLTATAVAPDGSTTVERWTASPEPSIDCFYVYPTVSRDPTPNSDMEAGPEERRAAELQLARFASACRLFAPMYRQVTLAALVEVMQGKLFRGDRDLAYHDVLDAWNDYLARDNHGRGVVLIGHSQGARIVTELLRREIEGTERRKQLVSALVLGSNLTVPQGRDVGGSLQHVPLCRSASQTGCVVAYVSFRSSSPPPPNTLFGRTPDPGSVVACTNPAALGGGPGVLRSYLPARGSLVALDAPQYPWTTRASRIDTPFVTVPGLLTAECVSGSQGSYLAVTPHPPAGGQRTGDIPGDVVFQGNVLHAWGLHLVDVNLAMGNLVEIVLQQAQAYRANQR